MIMSNLMTMLFGYKKDTEYWISINDVKIPYCFQRKSPNEFKFNKKLSRFWKYGELSKIVLNEDFELVDGYITYLICEKYNMRKIPVYFV